MERMVRSNYKINQKVNFSSLSEEECEKIYLAAVEILERTGAVVHDEETLEVLEDAGCWVEGEKVRFPSGVTQAAVNSAPSRVVFCDRNGDRSIIAEGNNTYYGPGPTNNYYIDPMTGERRKPKKEDKADVAKTCDYLPNIDFVMDLGTPDDVTISLSDIHSFDAMIRNTTKPIFHWGFDIDQYEDIIEMAAVVAGGMEELQKNPFIALYSEPTPPLIHSKEAIAKATYAGKYKLPIIYTPCVMSGGTTPATLAGTLALGIADSLVGLVANQHLNKGNPFIMGGVYTIMDMNSTVFSYGSPEFLALQSGIAEVAHHMGIPVFGTAGCTDSCTLDGQAAGEAAMSILTAAQSGANLVHDVGYTEYGSTGSLYQLVMGDEIIGMVKRIMKGIKVDKEHLATDVIDEVGPGGHFIAQDHTMKHFKDETWFPELINRQRYPGWKNDGGTTMGERVIDKTQKILKEHQAEPLSEDILKRLDEIVENAEKRNKDE
ncbi:trimethylamine methyltransferase family protein [Selenihalanaerobacter shriftii]|uniref:Trimethylamine---corrinoid protein Co-methyltransferase n=1 Tax=Selenihalanaerobacter shriftii TaxID=142842 RepID=A0A1T4RC61_9FIRM|nr:trimethylamine methyltransferase family protein [Selenihalanaerobacter shriftii]SKA13171.1 trimethylamine---corrinoid protein Co-methyltransferase [Selenihalanaerobacter shriftii]